MKRILVVVLCAAVLLAVAIAILAPAALMTPWLDRATRGRLAVTDAHGTLWRGQAALTATGARLPLAWTLDALPLLSGEARVHITPGDGATATPRADVAVADGHVALTDVSVVVPAAILLQAVVRDTSGRAGWGIDGEIAATTPRIEWTPAAASGGVQIVWRNARVVLPTAPPVDFGEATATLTAERDRYAGPVTNTGGNLDVRGTLAIGTAGSAAISLLLTPRREGDAELARALGTVGTPEGAGWRVNWKSGTP